MDLSLTESQQLLQEAARRFVTTEFPRHALVTWRKAGVACPPEAWARLANTGWLGLLVPEEHGGAGATVTDAAVLLEEFGRGPACSPMLTSGVLSVAVTAESGTAEQRGRFLPKLASGERVAALAVTEADARWMRESMTLTAAPVDGGFELRGTKVFVLNGTTATDFIVAAGQAGDSEQVSLYWIDAETPGVSARMLPGFLGLQAEVKFEGAVVGADQVLGGPGLDGWSALETAIKRVLPVVCAYQVGSCQEMFEMSVEYSRTREQFGVPIGRFQRVQDHIIRLVNALDAARWTTYEAAWRVDSDREPTTSAHMAKAVAAEAHVEAANAAHEVHAGMGSDIDFGLTLHSELSRLMESFLGSARWHKRRVADSLDW